MWSLVGGGLNGANSEGGGPPWWPEHHHKGGGVGADLLKQGLPCPAGKFVVMVGATQNS